MELLAPAGNLEKFKAALHFGADAVYLAGGHYGLRAFAGNFTEEEMSEAVKMAHEQGVKVFVTLNIIARDKDFENLAGYLKFLKKIGVDAVIVADIGMLQFIRQNQPDLDVHVSTQANIINSYSAKLMVELGAKRLILARELSIDEIAEIRKNIPKEIEIEVFVHGAMCMAYSGRCLLSNYLTGRDSNRGECVQACRWKYLVREVSREDELEVQEDEKGSYIFNSKDLNMLEHLDELQKIGVDSIKIEGRMKSAYYVATVVNAYRQALDMLPQKPDKVLCEELMKASHRHYTTGFYFHDEEKQFLEDSMPVQESEFVAIVSKDCDGKSVELEMRNKFSVGEELEILSPSADTFNKKLKIEKIVNSLGGEVESAKVVQEKVTVLCSLPLKAGDILRR
ncbi:MAG: U32 family peptidase [Clostridia bacterium]|nr:U32 family peptidase [Clostridia bacterium]